MAKVGGLADVVGALPKYQNAAGHSSQVIMPMHRTPFLFENEWEVSPWSGNTSAFLIPKMFSALHAALTNPKALDRIRLKLSASLTQSNARSLKDT